MVSVVRDILGVSSLLQCEALLSRFSRLGCCEPYGGIAETPGFCAAAEQNTNPGLAGWATLRAVPAISGLEELTLSVSGDLGAGL